MGVALSTGTSKPSRKALLCGCCEGKDDFELTVIEASIKKPTIPRVISTQLNLDTIIKSRDFPPILE
jgi:hypothetical protein